MTFFNKSLKLTLASILLAVLSGCGSNVIDKISPKKAPKNDLANEYYQNSEFWHEGITIARDAEILEFNNWGNAKKKLYVFKMCAKNRYLDQILDFEKIVVVDESGNEQDKQANHKGCIFWDETFEFDHFATEHYIEIERRFRTNTGGVRVSLALNPWNDELFDLTRQEVPAPIKLVTNKEKVSFNSILTPNSVQDINDRPRVFHESISLENNSIEGKGKLAFDRFKMDDYLNLTYAHNYIISFEPKVRSKNIHGATKEISPDSNPTSDEKGDIHLTMLFYKYSEIPNFDASNLVTSFSGKLNLDSTGKIKQDIVIETPDVSASDIKMYVLVKVDPVLDSSLVEPGYFKGIVGGLPSSPSVSNLIEYQPEVFESNVVNLENFDQDVAEYEDIPTPYDYMLEGIAQSDTKRMLDFNVPIDLLVHKKRNNLNHCSYRSGNFNYGGKVDLQEFFFSKNKEYTECEKKLVLDFLCRYSMPLGNDDKYQCDDYWSFGETYFSGFKQYNISKFELVEEIESVPEKVGRTDIFNISISASFGRSETQSTTWGNKTSKGIEWGANIGVSAGGGIGVGTDFWNIAPKGKPADNIVSLNAGASASLSASMSYGQSWYRVVGVSRSLSNSGSFSLNKNRKIFVDDNKYTFDALVRECLQIDFIETGVKNIICKPDLVRKTVEESFYYVRETKPLETATNDANDPSEQSFRMFIRGQGLFNSLLSLLENPEIEMLIQERSVDEDSSVLPRLLKNITQDEFGVLNKGEVYKFDDYINNR